MIPRDGFSALLREAQAGNKPAVETLLAALRPYLERAVRNFGGSWGAGPGVADLVQEACLRIWRKLDRFQGTQDDGLTRALFLGWVDRLVCRLGQNSLRDHRARRRTPPKGLVRLGEAGGTGGTGEPTANEPTPSWSLRHEEQRQRVRDALDRLPSQVGRAIVRLHFFDGISLREVARRLGLSYDQVRERYQVSMRYMGRELGPLP
jgi:RNA polymerase sigma factor (sigma-70 family)